MNEIVRALILVAIAGAAVMGIAWSARRWLNEDQRLRRALARVLEAPPEAVLVAHGAGRAVGISFLTRQVATAWDGGRWCLVYGLEDLVGAELSIDHAVAARVWRGEPRRALERTPPDAREASLRLVFDDPAHPDFDLSLWPGPSWKRGGPPGPREAIVEANRWLARIEAILRRPV